MTLLFEAPSMLFRFLLPPGLRAGLAPMEATVADLLVDLGVFETTGRLAPADMTVGARSPPEPDEEAAPASRNSSLRPGYPWEVAPTPSPPPMSPIRLDSEPSWISLILGIGWDFRTCD